MDLREFAKEAIVSGLAGYVVGAGRRVASKARDLARRAIISRKANFRRGMEAGMGTTPYARRKVTADTAQAVNKHDLQTKVRKAIKYGLIGAGGAAALGGAAYLAGKAKQKREEELAY